MFDVIDLQVTPDCLWMEALIFKFINVFCSQVFVNFDFSYNLALQNLFEFSCILVVCTFQIMFVNTASHETN